MEPKIDKITGEISNFFPISLTNPEGISAMDANYLRANNIPVTAYEMRNGNIWRIYPSSKYDFGILNLQLRIVFDYNLYDYVNGKIYGNIVGLWK